MNIHWEERYYLTMGLPWRRYHGFSITCEFGRDDEGRWYWQIEAPQGWFQPQHIGSTSVHEAYKRMADWLFANMELDALP